MKRHPKLIPLSREHHQQLLLAQLLKDNAPAYKGLPLNKVGKIGYAQDLFNEKIRAHFEKEDILFSEVRRLADQSMLTLIEKQENYQRELVSKFENIEASTLDSLGHLLEAAIRHEERVLFQAIQFKINLNSIKLTF